MIRKRIIYTLIFFVNCLILFGLQKTSAQMADYLYRSDVSIDSTQKRRLLLEMDNLSFFTNNEFNSTFQPGYTLPGFWLQMKTVYYPFENLKIEAGAHSIWFWGTSRYPAFAYKDLSAWKGKDYAHNVHILPYFRASLVFRNKTQIVMGNIYGGSNHGLIDPLYNPELNQSSDPESGAQFLYHSSRFDFDMWINWITFIYKLDTRQESFISGFTSKFKVNPVESRFHTYFLLQEFIQHRGGENIIVPTRVFTAINGAAGVGVRWNLNRRTLKYMNVEADWVGYGKLKGILYPVSRGYGIYSKFAIQLRQFHLMTSYWFCNNFLPLLGNPFYGVVSTYDNGMFFHRPEMLHFGVEYVYPIGKGFALGLQGSLYYFLSGKMYSRETGIYEYPPFGHNENFSVGICMRLNPSFLLKQY